MKAHTCLIGALLTICVPTYAQAYKIRFYSFAEQCLDADLIVIAHSLRCNGDTVSIDIAEYLLGSGTGELAAAFDRHPHPRFRPPDVIEGPRLVFLQKDDAGLRLVGSELQALWPQTVPDGRDYPFAQFELSVDFLSDLCGQVRGCADRESGAQVTSGLLDMFHSSDVFVRMAALQTCERLYGRKPQKYVDVVRLGSAFALETLAHPDRWIRNASLGLILNAPRSAGLRGLLRVMSAHEVARGSHDAAFVKFRSLTQEGRWDEQFQRRKSDPDRELRAAAVEHMREWLDENFSRILAEDYEMIMRELSSEDVGRRTTGSLWLRAAASRDLGFDEAATTKERENALTRVREWWDKHKN